jgi:hypothetical protein
MWRIRVLDILSCQVVKVTEVTVYKSKNWTLQNVKGKKVKFTRGEMYKRLNVQEVECTRSGCYKKWKLQVGATRFINVESTRHGLWNEWNLKRVDSETSGLRNEWARKRVNTRSGLSTRWIFPRSAVLDHDESTTVFPNASNVTPVDTA